MKINIFILFVVSLILGFFIASFLRILEILCGNYCSNNRDLLSEELEREMIEVIVQHNNLLYEIENFSFDKKKETIVILNPDHTISIGV